MKRILDVLILLVDLTINVKAVMEGVDFWSFMDLNSHIFNPYSMTSKQINACLLVKKKTQFLNLDSFSCKIITIQSATPYALMLPFYGFFFFFFKYIYLC